MSKPVRTINTSESIVEPLPRMVREEPRPQHHTVGTEVYDSMSYIDEGPELMHVVAAAGWVALVNEEERPLAFWAVLDDGSAHGVTVSGDGSIDVFESVADEDGFEGYKYIIGG